MRSDYEAWYDHHVHGKPKPTSEGRAKEAVDTIRAAMAKTSELVRAFKSAEDETRRVDYNPNGHLTGAGVNEARNKALEKLRADYTAQLEEHRETIDMATQRLTDYTAAEPLPDGDATARRGAHWRRAEALLDAGVYPSQVIRDTNDPEALLALREELPTRLAVEAAKRNGGGLNALTGRRIGDDDASEVLRAIDDRLADLDHPAAGYARARNALVASEAVARHVTDAQGVIDGKSMLSYAIAAAGSTGHY